MQETFADRIGAVFDGAERIDFQQGESTEGEYKFARISDIQPEDIDEKVRELSNDGTDATIVETARGLEVEVWTV